VLQATEPGLKSRPLFRPRAPSLVFSTMTEIWFYHLQRQPLEKVLPVLIEKSLEKGWRVAVQARSEERLEALDSWLWTYSDESFLAHGRAGDGDPSLQPVYLTDGNENPNGAALRLFVEGAEMAPALAASGAAYARVVALFDGNNEEEVSRARLQWKELKDLGLPVTYWQQGATGRWEMRARSGSG
jgi:DNA polymerase-3 subunit chi